MRIPPFSRIEGPDIACLRVGGLGPSTPESTTSKRDTQWRYQGRIGQSPCSVGAEDAVIERPYHCCGCKTTQICLTVKIPVPITNRTRTSD